MFVLDSIAVHGYTQPDRKTIGKAFVSALPSISAEAIGREREFDVELTKLLGPSRSSTRRQSQLVSPIRLRGCGTETTRLKHKTSRRYNPEPSNNLLPEQIRGILYGKKQ
jgi:hypothetical protein